MFNDLLRDAGVDLKKTRLVRHQDRNTVTGQSIHDLWSADDGRFQTYQRIQGRDRFKEADWIASFVATPLNETLFVGVYRIGGVSTAPPGTIDPMSGHDVTGYRLYDLAIDDALSKYVGRIIVDWGSGYRSWVQHAALRQKQILEIRRTAIEPPFPGFTSFTWNIRDLASVPPSWRVALSAVSGVYLLVSRTTGKQYVGSAYGSGGFWVRWEDYFRNAHGGNEGMKFALDDNYQVSVLEFVSSTLTFDEVIRLEARWKEKLLTRTFGLNRN